MADLTQGDFAPDFTLDIDGGNQVTLSELRGKQVVLYFYPKDDTSGCTQEAKDFRDNMQKFESKNVVVIGVSKDSVDSHEKFKAKHELNFILGSDEFSTVCEAYDTWVEKSMYGRKFMGIQRDTFLIGEDGKIKKIWRKVKVSGHVEEVLEAL